MKRALAIVFLISLTASGARADESGLASVQGRYFQTSDPFRRAELEGFFSNHRRDLLWPYADEKTDAWDFGVKFLGTSGDVPGYNYTAFRMLGNIARKLSNAWLLGASAGFDTLSTLTIGRYTSPAANINLQFFPSPHLYGTLQIGHSLIYSDLQPGSVTGGLAVTSVVARPVLMPIDRIRMPLSVSAYEITDGNSRLEGDISALYGISTGEPWIWLGFGVNDLRFTTTTNNYYSPSQALILGPRLDLAAAIGGEWSFGLGANGNWLYDHDSASWSVGYYLFGRIQYGDRNAPNFSFGYEGIRSARFSSVWTSSGFSLTYSRPI